MAGRSRSSALPIPSSVLIAGISLIGLISVFFFLSSSPRCISSLTPTAAHLPTPRNSNPNSASPEYSFVAALEKFLASGSPTSRPPDTAAADEVAVAALDDSIWRSESERMAGRSPDPWSDLSVVRVYVYEMPAKFTYDLLRLFRDTYRETDNATSNGSPVHRLIEQHSIDYWLWSDLIAAESGRLLKNVVRVHRQEEADLFYIPFFTTISYFLLEKQQCKALYRDALKWVTAQPAWNRSGGRDHILPVHHPWSFKSVRRFMKKAIWLLPDMDSTGNWYKPGEVWLEKDLILPYVANGEYCDAQCLSRTQPQRSMLLFFVEGLKEMPVGRSEVNSWQNYVILRVSL